MAKKIDEKVLEKLQIVCYNVALCGQINEQLMSEVRHEAEKYLSENGYDIDYVKCDFENNTPDVIDSNKLLVDIIEIAVPGSSERYKHRIVL